MSTTTTQAPQHTVCCPACCKPHRDFDHRLCTCPHHDARQAVPTAEQRSAEVRRMVAARGWTAELERIGSMRVALAMQACGLAPPPPAPRCEAHPNQAMTPSGHTYVCAECCWPGDDDPWYAGGMTPRQERMADRSDL